MLLKVTSLTPMKENKTFSTHDCLGFKPSVTTNRLSFILFWSNCEALKWTNNTSNLWHIDWNLAASLKNVYSEAVTWRCSLKKVFWNKKSLLFCYSFHKICWKLWPLGGYLTLSNVVPHCKFVLGWMSKSKYKHHRIYPRINYHNIQCNYT